MPTSTGHPFKSEPRAVIMQNDCWVSLCMGLRHREGTGQSADGRQPSQEAVCRGRSLGRIVQTASNSSHASAATPDPQRKLGGR